MSQSQLLCYLLHMDTGLDHQEFRHLKILLSAAVAQQFPCKLVTHHAPNLKDDVEVETAQYVHHLLATCIHIQVRNTAPEAVQEAIMRQQPTTVVVYVHPAIGEHCNPATGQHCNSAIGQHCNPATGDH